MASNISQVCGQLSQQIESLLAWRAELRRKEKNLRNRQATLESQYQATGGALTAQSLAAILPPELLPRNIGPLDKVAWPFWYEFDFDFGSTPVLDSTTMQAQNVQVSQEAGFMLLYVSQNFEDPLNEAGGLGPYQISIQDNQSTRQFNNSPIPLQMIGSDSRPTEFPTPYLFQPNASMKVTANTWLIPGESMATTGTDSAFSISIWGLRVRVDVASTLNTFFSKS